jgi:hypothetical protein
MSDLERRLRDAMKGAAEQPPSGLMEAVRRRHRRYQIRTGAGAAAVIAAVAIAAPPVAGALRSGDSGGHGHGPVAGHTSHTIAPSPRPHASAAPGTALVGCGSGPNAGQLSRLAHYRASGQPLPLRFLDGGHSSGRIRLYVAIAVLKGLRPGMAVVVTVPRADRGDLRFLYADSLTPGTRYTMHSGEAGVTFVACSPSQETFPSPGMTDYYGAYIVRGTRCVPVNVRIPAWRKAGVIRLGACQGQ